MTDGFINFISIIQIHLHAVNCVLKVYKKELETKSVSDRRTSIKVYGYSHENPKILCVTNIGGTSSPTCRPWFETYLCYWLYRNIHDGKVDCQVPFILMKPSVMSRLHKLTKQHATVIQKIHIIDQIPLHGVWPAVNTRRIIGTVLFYNAVN
jgi:hypothetical protein